ncbi:thioredoxin [Chitinophaga silvatica]|uniref:Thioredoxin n=1 Tax=Chitinophaga silvatica TaxID=2282649 RepID=A0A3E1YHI3_9BACT|nr:thioredoxin family protein [Chitinophaga silvatica]RFS26690.1 thioredoxin [Chitinophaga silvatica]
MQLRLLFVLLLNFYAATILAQQAPGIRFQEGNWENLVALAQKAQLPIFVDVYTDWCAPCKQMDASVFKEKLVGDKYNKTFISYKLNAEKGEGPALAKQFNIKAYPTFLFLNSSGFLIHKVVGEKESGPFLAIADEALAKLADKDQLGNLEETFKKGNRQPQFLRKFITAKAKLDIDNSELFTELINAYPVDSLQTEETLVFIGSWLNGLQTPALQFLMQNYNTLSSSAKEKIKPRLFRIIVNRGMTSSINATHLLEYEQLISYARQLEPLNEEQYKYLNRLSLIYAGLTKNSTMVKEAGYKAIGTLMDVSVADVKKEDLRVYNELMGPFLRGEQDSTKYPDFQEEKKMIVNTYSREIVSKLLTVATAFSQTLPANDPARKDALRWAERANMLWPESKEVLSLIQKLKK